MESGSSYNRTANRSRIPRIIANSQLKESSVKNPLTEPAPTPPGKPLTEPAPAPSGKPLTEPAPQPPRKPLTEPAPVRPRRPLNG